MKTEKTVKNADYKADYMYEPIEGTPFTMVKGDGVYFIVMGKWRLTDQYATYEDAKEAMNTWGFQIAVMACIAELHILNHEDVIRNQYKNNFTITKDEEVSNKELP